MYNVKGGSEELFHTHTLKACSLADGGSAQVYMKSTKPTPFLDTYANIPINATAQLRACVCACTWMWVWGSTTTACYYVGYSPKLPLML